MDFESDPRVVAVPRATRLRRLLRRTCFAIGILGILLTISAVIGVYDISAPVRYRWQVIARIKSVEGRDAMTDAVGRLGVVLDHPNGEWTAITYKDAHNFGFPSVAVVRTSDDTWYISRAHHCGLFRTYELIREDASIFQPDNPALHFEKQDERLRLLHSIEHEAVASKRAELLARLGFRPL